MNMLRVPAVQPDARIETLTAERDEYKRLALITDTVTRECKIQEARAEKADADNARLRAAMTALHKQALMLRGDQSYREFARAVEKQARAALNTGKEVMPNGASKVPNNDIGPGDQGVVAGAALPTVDKLAQIIRTVDGKHSLGAGELAERILEALNTGKEANG